MKASAGVGPRPRHARWVALAGCLLLVVPAAPTEARKARPAWQTLAPMPTARTEATTVVMNGEIYVMGGYAAPLQTVPIVEIYNPKEDAWRSGPPLVLPVNHAPGAVVDDTIYVFGGYLGYALGSQAAVVAAPTDLSFALRDGIWEPIAPLPEPRAAGGAAVVGDKIVLVGGVLADGTLATNSLLYDPATDAWTELPGLDIPRQHLGVTSARGKVYAIGGRIDLFESNLSISDVFDPRTEKWQTLPNMPTPRGGLATAATSNGFVVAIGGEGFNGTNPEVEALDVRFRRWLKLPLLPTPRHGLGVVAIGNVIYAVGGGPTPSYSYSGANEAIDLSGFKPAR